MKSAFRNLDWNVGTRQRTGLSCCLQQAENRQFGRLFKRLLFWNIVAAFQRMHVSPAKHSYAWLPRKCVIPDRQTDRQIPDKVIPMCHYASQATQKLCVPWINLLDCTSSLLQLRIVTGIGSLRSGIFSPVLSHRLKSILMVPQSNVTWSV